jgi:hypothetical protein
MEDKIEVREYVRTKDGIIAQIKNIDYEAEIYRFDRTIYINDFGMKNDVLYNNEMFKKVVVKHSKQLKDLIESGDLIIYRLRGLKHQCKGFIRIYKDARSGKENLGINNYSLEQIEIIKILTHEQIEANCYKVGGEDGI